MTARLDAIGLVVADMARSLAFYRALGLDIPAAADSETHVEVALSGSLRLMFDTAEEVRSMDAAWSPAKGGPPISLAFLCDSPEDVDRLYSELVQAGFNGHLEPWDAPWGQRYATIRDPDGNGVDLFARLG